jgi:hypothetical protein
MRREMITKNAIIESTKLGFDRGFFNFWLTLDYGGSGQSFGGYTLDEYSKETNEREGHAFGTDCLIQILKTVDVESWEQLKGKNIRAILSDDTFSAKILGIGHIIKDKWFIISELQEKHFPEEKN